MNSGKKFIRLVFPVLFMILLIIDSQAAIQSASQGVELCIRTVIPSLFPFFYLSGLISSNLSGRSYRILRPLGKICGIPQGAEPIMLLGMVGGYPIGAQSIQNAYKIGCLKKQDAERMLGFCNQPGPAFIFGIVGSLFCNHWIPFVIWIALLASAILTAIVLPNNSKESCVYIASQKVKPFENSIVATASVCGWVILFRVLITMLQRWMFYAVPESIAVGILGVLEITNGCILLHQLNNSTLEFILITAILTFGGCCVAMQTKSVARDLSCKTYFLGKLVQTSIAAIMAILLSFIIFR